LAIQRDHAPLDIAAIRAKVGERFAAIEAATGARPKGRKAAFVVLLATDGHGATIDEVRDVLGGGKTPAKGAIHRLVNEGLAKRDVRVPGGHLYKVTEHGDTVGYAYVPPTISTPASKTTKDDGWGKAGSVRIATLKVLLELEPDDLGLTIRQILERTGSRTANDAAVGRTLKLGESKGFVEATTPGRTDTAGVYRLTELGRQTARAYLDACDMPASSVTVTFTGDTTSDAYKRMLELLGELATLENVQVSGLPLQEED
jgi:DNA-binding PadR family transcriptional regulator